MRAFISDSVRDEDYYIIGEFAQQLREQGMTPIARSLMSFQASGPDVFYGIVLEGGSDDEKVWNEWQLAKEKRLPLVMLIDKDSDLATRFLLGNEDNGIILLDKKYPERAKSAFKKHIEQANKHNGKNLLDGLFKNKWFWTAAGVAFMVIVGLIIINSRKKVEA